jgi:hypothetical protein
MIPAAKVANSNEGLMAFLVITIWHIFNADLHPDVFPFDASIFTGQISRERMEPSASTRWSWPASRAGSLAGT